MGFTLVVCNNTNIRKFYVYNLIRRGHFALGVSNLADQVEEFWQQEVPELVVTWGAPAQLEEDISLLHQHYNSNVPVVVVDHDKPSPAWMASWGIAASTTHLWDSRQLVSFLQPWLNRESL